MLRKMRWRFIGSAMIAFSAVVLILLLVINLWNYSITTSRQDETLELLGEFENAGVFWASASPVPYSKEMQYTTRFFTVRCDTRGRIVNVYREYIASISTEEAKSYATDVLNRRGDTGYYNGFRYLVCHTNSGVSVIFLNAEEEITSMRSLLLVSVTVALLSLVAVFLLVLLFSKRAIAPYVRNIEAQKRFITDASHELKTPLTAISTSADILSMEQEDSEWVRNIQSQSARLSKLISNLVTLSRLGEEQPFPERTDFSLSDAVWEIAEPMAALAKAREKTYVQSIDDGITVHGDRNAIQQAVSILLDNALKYSSEHGEISLRVCKRPRRAEITVYNTCEIDDYKHIDKLFDRFYRPDESRSQKTGGTGIGLSIARATVEAHGGRISAESPDGKSITFRISIPR